MMPIAPGTDPTDLDVSPASGPIAPAPPLLIYSAAEPRDATVADLVSDEDGDTTYERVRNLRDREREAARQLRALRDVLAYDGSDDLAGVVVRRLTDAVRQERDAWRVARDALLDQVASRRPLPFPVVVAHSPPQDRDPVHREPDDDHATLGDLRGTVAWEPHAGGGAFVRALVAAGARTHYSDIDADAPAYTSHNVIPDAASGFVAHDALAGWPDERIAPELIIGNPPFDTAEAHVRMALDTATAGVAFLLRLAFLEGAKRRTFWREHPASQVHVLVSRPSFTGGSTDSAAYGWFVWWKRHPGPTELRHLDWKGA